MHLLSVLLSPLILINLYLRPSISFGTMVSFSSLFLVGTLALQSVFSFPDGLREREAEIRKRDVDSFIAREKPIALAGVLCNIGSGMLSD